MYYGRDINCYAPSGIAVRSKHWSNKMGRFKNDFSQDEASILVTEKMRRLEKELLKRYQEDYTEGANINSNWLKSRIKEIWQQRETDAVDDPATYFVPYFEQFVSTQLVRTNPKTGKVYSRRTVQKYNTTHLRLREFEAMHKEMLKHNDIDMDFYNAFIDFLSTGERNLSPQAQGAYIRNIKTVCKKAEHDGYLTNPAYRSSEFVKPTEKAIDTFLNEAEIQQIFDLDLDLDGYLDNARDWLIIGVWTGLRVSDLLNLKSENVSEKTKRIQVHTFKTGKLVTIPLQDMVVSTLAKREWNFPRKISDVKFNKYIKEVGQLAGLTEPIAGTKINQETKRKEKGHFPKYQLMSSHICRRSFATNFYGGVPDMVIMAVTGHQNIKQFQEYVKATNEDLIYSLEKYFEKNLNKP
jgi:integrase